MTTPDSRGVFSSEADVETTAMTELAPAMLEPILGKGPALDVAN